MLARELKCSGLSTSPILHVSVLFVISATIWYLLLIPSASASARMSSTKSYPLSASYWPESKMIEVYDVNNNRLCTIPIAFLEASGDLNWHFVSNCVRACVEDDGLLLLDDNAEGISVDLESPVVGGRYFYRRQDSITLPVRLRRGPIGNRRGKAPGVTISESGSTLSSVQSTSSRYSADQQKLKVGVIARDYSCLVTDEPFSECKAAHIVPYSRPDILNMLLGYSDEWRFHSWMGLLLADRIHTAFDAYQISIYPRATDWVVHVFDDPFLRMVRYHGKSFTSERFRGPSHLWPRRDLLLWHHQQCVQKHFRGYSSRMTAADEIEESRR